MKDSQTPLILNLYLHSSCFFWPTVSPVFRWQFLPMLRLKKKKHNKNLDVNKKIHRGMQSKMMLQIKPRIRPSKIQKLPAICNYGGNCYFKMFSFFQRNSMLLVEILGILNHRKSFRSWWRLNITGNQNNVLSTYFSWLKKSSFLNFFKKSFYYVVRANYSILFHRPKH